LEVQPQLYVQRPTWTRFWHIDSGFKYKTSSRFFIDAACGCGPVPSGFPPHPEKFKIQKIGKSSTSCHNHMSNGQPGKNEAKWTRALNSGRSGGHLLMLFVVGVQSHQDFLLIPKSSKSRKLGNPGGAAQIVCPTANLEKMRQNGPGH